MSKKKNIQPQTKAKPFVQPEMKKSAGWKPYLVLTIFAFILYGNTLNHYFALDDGVVIIENSFTQKGIKGIPNIFKNDIYGGHILYHNQGKDIEQVLKELKMAVGGRYRPLSLATFALEVEFFGKKYIYPNSNNSIEFKGNAFVSHLNNILLYLFTTCLLYLILCRLFPIGNLKIQKFKNLKDITVNAKPSSPICEGAWEKWYLSFPFIASLLFLAHPIHTEVVANIKGRDEIMTLLGSLAALWFTIKYFDTNKIYNLLLSGLCLFLGLLSKENAITFLAVIPITIYYFINKGINPLVKPLVKSMIPLILASALFLWIRANALGSNANIAATGFGLMENPFLDATKAETMATVFYTLFLYVKLLIFPHPLTWDYYPYHIEIVNWANPVAILSLLFYLGITAYAIYGFIKHATVKSTNQQINKLTIISYSIWFYLLPLSIVSNLFFSVGVFMGERFIFISSIGFCIFIGWLIYNYLSKFTQINKLTNQQINKSTTYLPYFILFIILCLYSAKTIHRNMAWKDNFTLLETDIKTSYNSAKMNFSLGGELLRKANYPTNEDEKLRKSEMAEKSMQHLKRAIELYPEYDEAIEALGNLYFDCYKDIAKSLRYHAMLPRTSAYISAQDILNRVPMLLYTNQISSTPEEIIQSCDELLTIMPDLGEAYYIKGVIYGISLHNAELSLMNFEKADASDFPKTIDYYNNAGFSCSFSGNYAKAIYYLLKAIELGTNDHATYLNLGRIYQQLGDTNKANFYMKKGEELTITIESK